MGAVTDQMVMLIIGIILILAGIISLVWLAVSLVKKKATKLNNIISLLVGVAFVLCGTYLAIDFFNKDKQTPFEVSLIEQAKELNKSLPKMLDENTRFDEVTVYGTEVYYRHTVVNHAVDQLDREIFQQIMNKKLTREQCPKNDIITLLKGGVKYRYNYFGNRGALISSVVISKETCGVR